MIFSAHTSEGGYRGDFARGEYIRVGFNGDDAARGDG